MEMLIKARKMSIRCLCRLVLQALPKIFAFSPSLLKTFQRDEHVHPPLIEAAIVGSELPVEIIMDILSLLEIPDLVRAGSVCSSWHAAYTSVRSLGMYRSPRTPCLLYTSESDADNVACLYSLAEKRVYKLTLPEPPIRNRYLIGSTYGWLVTADEMSELDMVNPITGEQFSLPSVTTIEQVKPIYDDNGAIQKYEFSEGYGAEEVSTPSVYDLDKLRDYLYVKAFVFFESSSGSCIVVLIHNPSNQLSFAKTGDRSWTWLPPSAFYRDCDYMDGLLYAVTDMGGIDVFDLTGPTVSRKVIMDRSKGFPYEQLYLLLLPCGDLLQVWREQDVVRAAEDEGAPEHDPPEFFMETRKIMMYKVDMNEKELVEVYGLQDYALFLGLSSSFLQIADGNPQLENRVYLTDDDQGFTLRKSYRRDVCVFNLENNKIEEIVSPRLWSSWPAPIWIKPSLSKVSSGNK
ncbi:unnamed protein product [Urochloa decumbens]|uniref:F-box domain-containing protein n=1 Tax=Urochloa decumbens TaxID=240449 RepID=A0ABC9AVW8_9POAL